MFPHPSPITDACRLIVKQDKHRSVRVFAFVSRQCDATHRRLALVACDDLDSLANALILICTKKAETMVAFGLISLNGVIS